MRHHLPEYYKPTEKEIKELWQNGTIILDANVLLNLFRYSSGSREELIKILKHYKNRLWVPYQVAFEFLENSISVPASLSRVLSDTLKSVDSMQGAIEDHLKLNRYNKYHLLKPDDIRKDIRSFQKRLHAKVAKIQKEYNAINKEDIVKQISNLLDGKVGEDYDENRLCQLFKEGEKRYQEKTPPGYKDLEDKIDTSKRHLYGDLIWWMQAIDYAKENKCDFVIVTDDAKEDWWNKVDNKTIGPRVELIREFSRETGGRKFHMYRTSQFMEAAKKYDKVAVSETSIKEVKARSSRIAISPEIMSSMASGINGVNGVADFSPSLLSKDRFYNSYYLDEENMRDNPIFYRLNDDSSVLSPRIISRLNPIIGDENYLKSLTDYRFFGKIDEPLLDPERFAIKEKKEDKAE